MIIKSVNIDGTDYVIRRCCECMFYYSESGGTRSHCLHPKNRMKNLDDVEYDIVIFPDDCPLGLVKDCCTCKYTYSDYEEPCINCMYSFNPETGEESPPSKWEVRE